MTKTLSFFSMFEHSLESIGLDQDVTLMPQRVFTGKTQTYVFVSPEECKDYKKVKAVVLKAIELVTDLYGQHFQNWKSDKQSHGELIGS